MAASLVGLILAQTYNALQNTLWRNTKIVPRAVFQVQFVREKRRSCYRRPWHVVRKGSGLHEKELTPENQKFLKETVTNAYEDKLKDSPLKDGPWQRHPWTLHTLRSGVLALKIGVIPQWTKDGDKFYTTLLQVIDNHVIRYIPPEEYSVKSSTSNNRKRLSHFGCAVVGALSTDPFKFSKAYCGLFAEAGVPPKRKLTRFFVTPDAAVQPGTPLYANHFKVGDYVDVQAKTIGHGFQGVVKRWGFKGGPASHGTTKWHRRPGNIGGGRGKGKVFKGKKLPGHMGMEWSKLKGLKIWRINTKYNILYVHGQAVPGPTHCYVRIYDTVLRYRREEMLKNPPIMPTFFPGDRGENLEEEIFDEKLFQFTQPTITFAENTKAKS